MTDLPAAERTTPSGPEGGRPYLGRGANVSRCERCYLPVKQCICEDWQACPASVEFCLLTHNDEVYKPSNTGRLIKASVTHTQRFIWHRTEPDERLLALLNNPDCRVFIVFPPGEDYQQRMVRYQSDPEVRSVFLILDGTWRQARRMFRLSKYLQHLPVISLQVVPESRYELRKAIHTNQLCTAEVAIALLAETGDQAASEHLNRYFEAFNLRSRQARSQ